MYSIVEKHFKVLRYMCEKQIIMFKKKNIYEITSSKEGMLYYAITIQTDVFQKLEIYQKNHSAMFFFALPRVVARHRCANCRLHIVSEVHIKVGEMQTSINTLDLPFNELLRSQVSFEFR